MIGALCPNCGQPLPPRDVARCPACGAELVQPLSSDGPLRSKTITHPIIGGSIEMPAIPQLADKFDSSHIAEQHERSQLFTWLGCMGIGVGILGIGGLVAALLIDPQLAVAGGAAVLLGALMAFLFYRRSLRLDRAIEMDQLELALRDFHHLED